MTWTTKSFSDVEELFEELMRLTSSEVLMACRGQPDATDSLRSSLDRILHRKLIGKDYASCLREEQILLENFVGRARELLGIIEWRCLESVATRNRLEAFAVLQHYGAPTRLLDWTRSPWVALYFAAVNDLDKDGAVWLFEQRAFEKEVGNSWTKHGLKQRPDRTVNLNDTAFETNGPPWISGLHYLFPFQRMEVQQGFFTVAGRLGLDHDVLIAELLKDPGPHILTIPAKLKGKILTLLRTMNIHAQSLNYPAADKVGRDLKRELEAKFQKTPSRP